MSATGFDFVKFCNEGLSNSNEVNIARVIISNIDQLYQLTLEKIAHQAHISTASVSRFINKAGFDNFNDFKHELDVFATGLVSHRRLHHTMRFNQKSSDYVGDAIYEDVFNNILATKENLDPQKLKEIVTIFKSSSSVTIVGDSHELDIFYRLQLELLINNVPAYLINHRNLNEQKKIWYGKKDVIFFVSVYDQWLPESTKDFLETVHSQGAITVVMAQEVEKFEKLDATVYQYGIPGSINDGYYSLPYINSLMCEYIYLPEQ